MIAIPNDRPVLTVTEAARASGVDRRAIRRRLDSGEFPNAYRDVGSQGPETGPWLIPVEDLLRAGLTLRAPMAPDASILTSFGRSEQESLLQSALADALRRAEVAEATAAERERIIEAQELALRAFAAAVELKESVPLETISISDHPEPDAVEAVAAAGLGESQAPEPEISAGLSDSEAPVEALEPEAPAEPDHPDEAEPEAPELEALTAPDHTDESEPEAPAEPDHTAESEPEAPEPEAPEPEALTEPDATDESGEALEPEALAGSDHPDQSEPEASEGASGPGATARQAPAILPGAPSRPTPPWVPVAAPPIKRRWWQRKYR